MAGPQLAVDDSYPLITPVETRDNAALQLFVRNLQILAGSLFTKGSDSIGSELMEAVGTLPSHPSLIVWWTVRGLTLEAALRLHGGAAGFCELDLRRDVATSTCPRELRDRLARHFRLGQALAATRKTSDDIRVERAVAYIRANCARRSLRVAEVSRQVQMSRWHFSRLLVRQLGVPYRDVVRRARMDEAGRLLLDNLLAVKEVAARLGYPHSASLGRDFKRCFGVTPTEWRTLQQGIGAPS
jgi:AraC-like DNA-binding protein